MKFAKSCIAPMVRVKVPFLSSKSASSGCKHRDSILGTFLFGCLNRGARRGGSLLVGATDSSVFGSHQRSTRYFSTGACGRRTADGIVVNFENVQRGKGNLKSKYKILRY